MSLCGRAKQARATLWLLSNHNVTSRAWEVLPSDVEGNHLAHPEPLTSAPSNTPGRASEGVRPADVAERDGPDVVGHRRARARLDVGLARRLPPHAGRQRDADDLVARSRLAGHPVMGGTIRVAAVELRGPLLAFLAGHGPSVGQRHLAGLKPASGTAEPGLVPSG